MGDPLELIIGCSVTVGDLQYTHRTYPMGGRRVAPAAAPVPE